MDLDHRKEKNLSSAATSADGQDLRIISSAGKSPGKRNQEKGHVQTNTSSKLKDLQNALGRHTTYRIQRKPPWSLNRQLLLGMFL